MIKALAILAAFFAASAALAHESRPLAVFIAERADGRVDLRWRAPPSIDDANAPRVVLDAPCTAISPAESSRLSGSALYRCPAGAAIRLSVEYPLYNPSVSTLIRYGARDPTTTILSPGEARWTALRAEEAGGAGVAGAYFLLGVEHIVAGIDHVLFLAGLLLLARTPMRVLVTATGFTIAHSATLALVALDLVRVSVPAVEAAIALSIVFVAAEIARGDQTTIAFRRPALVALAFGLLHGAGFASALGEIGLPPSAKAPALLFFNIGVEAGQIMLIGAAFLAVRIAKLTLRPPWKSIERLAAYAIGVPAAYWTIERVLAAA